MKIAILIDKMYPGSTPKFSGSEAKYLNEFGHPTEIVVIMGGGLPKESFQRKEFLKEAKITELSDEFRLSRWFDVKIPFFSFLSLYHLLSPLYVPRMIKKRGCDVVIAYNSLTCITACMAYKICGIPYVAYMWDPFSYIFEKVYAKKLPNFISNALLILIKRVDKLVVDNSLFTLSLSEEHAKFLRDLSKNRVEVIYVGCVPLEEIPPKRGDYLLAIDRWDMGNKPHMLLDVLQGIEDKKIKLKITGFWSEEWLKEEFKNLVKRKNLQDRVELMEPVSESELRELFTNARVWLHPIEETSVSMPALEAASCGCPIVMPKGTPLFEHGVNAFFPKEGDIGEYTAYVNKLVSDERLAYRMGYASWIMAKRHDWKTHTQEIIKSIQEKTKDRTPLNR